MVSARPSPARSAYKQQSLVLAEVKAFDRASLRHVDATRVTELGGVVRMEANARLQVRWSGGAQGPGPVACAPPATWRPACGCVQPAAWMGRAWDNTHNAPLHPRG